VRLTRLKSLILKFRSTLAIYQVITTPNEKKACIVSDKKLNFRSGVQFVPTGEHFLLFSLYAIALEPYSFAFIPQNTLKSDKNSLQSVGMVDSCPLFEDSWLLTTCKDSMCS
jgi:hypothetical protein